METRTGLEPSYPFIPGTSEYDLSHNKVPVWADRILFTPVRCAHLCAFVRGEQVVTHPPPPPPPDAM